MAKREILDWTPENTDKSKLSEIKSNVKEDVTKNIKEDSNDSASDGEFIMWYEW